MTMQTPQMKSPSKTLIFKVKYGYDILKPDKTLYHFNGQLIKVGKVGEKWKPSGRLIKQIPNEIKHIFFKIQ